MIQRGKDHGHFQICGCNVLEIKNNSNFLVAEAQSAPILNPVMCE